VVAPILMIFLNKQLTNFHAVQTLKASREQNFQPHDCLRSWAVMITMPEWKKHYRKYSSI